MIANRFFAFQSCPLRKGLDVLSVSTNERGEPLSFVDALRTTIDGETLGYYIIPVDSPMLNAAAIIPDEDEFDICVPSAYRRSGGEGQVGFSLIAAKRTNYIIVKDKNLGYYVGFFASFKGITHTTGTQTPENCDVYIFHLERDVVNTAIQNGFIQGINGAAVLAARTDCADIKNKGFVGGVPFVNPVRNTKAATSKMPVEDVTAVRVMGLYTSTPQAGSEGWPGEVFWVQSQAIPYNGDSGTEDATQLDNFKRVYASFEYLSTCTGFVDTASSAATWRVQLQKLYIIPDNYAYKFEYTQGLTVRAHFGHVGEAGNLPYNLFNMWTPDGGCHYVEKALNAPSGWESTSSRITYTGVSLGTFQKRVEIPANEIAAGARILYGLSGEDLFITIKAGNSTTDITDAFVAPILSNEAQQLLEAQKTSNAVSGVAAAVSVATGIVTGNPLAAIGGVLSGAQLIGELSTQKTTPYTIEANSKAFRTLYGLDGWKTGTRGGIYWERVPTFNPLNIEQYGAAFGERFVETPIRDIRDVFVNGTGDKNCLYFKLSGGVLDALVDSNDGVKILTAFQEGVRVWKDWRKMRLCDYGHYGRA